MEKMQTPPSPDGVIAYLTVSDGEAAIAFYRAAFDAQEVFRSLADDGKRLLHARLAINNGMIMLSDDFPEFRGVQSKAPAAGHATGVMLAMWVPDCDATFASAVAAGATPLMPPADMFWGERFCQLRDPFGHEWGLNGPLSAQQRSG